jgi:hypothetical protein
MTMQTTTCKPELIELADGGMISYSALSPSFDFPQSQRRKWRNGIRSVAWQSKRKDLSILDYSNFSNLVAIENLRPTTGILLYFKKMIQSAPYHYYVDYQKRRPEKLKENRSPWKSILFLIIRRCFSKFSLF